MSNPLNYVPAAVPDDCTFKISPSAFSSFIDRPWTWYQQEVLKNDVFEYNTSSVIGTIVHYVAECVATDKKVDEDAIAAYIEQHEENENYCKQTVIDQWYLMAHELINNFVLPEKQSFLATEEQVHLKIANGVYAAGTFDLLQGSKEDCCLTDYKTYNSKTKPKEIPPYYRYQLLVYAYILRKLGYNVTRIRLVYVNRNIDGGISEKTNKPLKSYPPEVTVLTETLLDESLDFIKGQLMLCHDSLQAVKDHPELTHVIFHDPRLKV